ncbi:Crp/Fnr family transcriptional regulator [Alkaliphilus serpentinus]|uniref:Crp/Fnr family transcriptional regulator n=1 Tax=Alkaliphilus serpentinus TaxID=1482731 RepID=A0A833M9U1_9FIRM|nr:Crp/Fnr family transcriptional regulator [Alkaliphilus serpentinus]KAB3529273.1 Crp/Fnr family transcriptional regulator [Alkaliphilus serpentinus]
MKSVCNCESCLHGRCTSKVPLFAGLDSKEQSRITELINRRSYSKGEMIFLQGDIIEGLYIINQGKIKVFKYTREGKEQILYILSVGDFVGELCLIKAEEANYNVETIEDVEICLIRRNDFLQLLDSSHSISIKLLENVGSRLLKLEKLVQSLGTKEVESRIAQMLLDLSKEFGHERENSVEINIPLTREDMANFIGVTRETISRKLSLLQDHGVITLVGSKTIIINSIETLKDYI